MKDLLFAHGEDSPSGENLEYDPLFSELEIAAQPGEERQMGDVIVEAEEPNYKDVIEKAEAVLEKSHDLRAAVYLALAELKVNGLAGLMRATGFIRFCLTDHWETCHPQLDAEDDNDPTMRVNAVLGLSDPETIIRALRRTPLTKSAAFGGISLRDIEIAEGELTPGPEEETLPDSQTVSAAFQDTPDEVLQEIGAAAAQALQDVEAIDSVFDAQTPGQGPDLDPLIKVLRRINRQFAGLVGGTDSQDEADPDDDEARAAAPSPAKGGAVGAISSRQDVRAALDRIIDYYARHEPSSPLPVLLHRAKRLVGADFMTIIRDMAPSGTESVQLIGGMDSDEEAE